MTFLCFLFAIAAAQLTGEDWELFKIKFGKSYDKPEEQEKRMGYFMSNLIYIQSQNKLNHSYALSVNSLSDSSPEEMAAMLNVKLDGKDLSAFVQVNKVKSPVWNLRVNIPTSVDWRDFNKVTSVKDQGRCGACWAFATIATAESFIALTRNKLYDLSEEYILQCTNGSDCSGGYVSAAMQKIIGGVPNDTAYPYKASMLISGKPTSTGICSYSKLIQLDNAIINRYANMTDSDLRTILSSHPVVAHFKAETAFTSYSKGVYSCSPNTTIAELNHAVSVIGYDNSNNYIIKNSWNQWWGQDGFAYIDSVNDCGIKLIVYEFKDAAKTLCSIILYCSMIILLNH